ncbi:MAG: NADH-quinone oxidoreductase subunit NuoG [Baekduia sp.]
MPRPEIKEITFTIDDREVAAPENMMLVDAAKLGDVEIPVFCYEPKLGAPVGACRMCLVEIEGIPKLQTACSTPVKEGMVVRTETERVEAAQNAVVEFLLINHPLDCPVCDKGGECPLQDISFGWGRGVSRFVEPKRHFEKPIALSPLIAIDRERCILCYRCVRFSQELSEDYQLIFRERGAHTFVATFDGTPYVAPFSGNITELCPVGALTTQAYRFRARPWDIDGAGTVCTLCPAQCNITQTVRDDRVLRVLARANHDVDDGWLCDRGRFGYQANYAPERVTTPMVRDGGVLRPASWERALDEAAGALRRAGARAALIAGGATTGETGLLAARVARDLLGTADIDSRERAACDAQVTEALADPRLQATVADLEYAHTVLVLGTEPLDDAPILDLRLRKGIRRNGVKVAIATARPSALDPGAASIVRLAPGDEPRMAGLLAQALTSSDVPGELGELVGLLKDGGEDIVILYGERVLADPAGGAALLAIAEALGLAGRDGAGLLAIPTFANGRGLREAGVVPFTTDAVRGAAKGRGTAGIRDAAAAGEVAALWLVGVDPARDLPGGERWEAGLERASSVVAHATFLTEGLAEHANVVLPAELPGEADGILCHPGGRLQRARQGVARAGEVKPGWWVVQELARRLGHDFGLVAGAQASRLLLESVPRYEGVTLDTIGGDGVVPEGDSGRVAVEPPPAQIPEPGQAPVGGRLRLGTHRSPWDGAEAEHSPALAFLSRSPVIELAPDDAARLDLREGAAVLLRSDDGSSGTARAGGHEVRASLKIRTGVPVGSAFLSAELLDGPLVSIDPAPPEPEPVLAGVAIEGEECA